MKYFDTINLMLKEFFKFKRYKEMPILIRCIIFVFMIPNIIISFQFAIISYITTFFYNLQIIIYNKIKKIIYTESQNLKEIVQAVIYFFATPFMLFFLFLSIISLQFMYIFNFLINIFLFVASFGGMAIVPFIENVEDYPDIELLKVNLITLILFVLFNIAIVVESVLLYAPIIALLILLQFLFVFVFAKYKKIDTSENINCEENNINENCIKNDDAINDQDTEIKNCEDNLSSNSNFNEVFDMLKYPINIKNGNIKIGNIFITGENIYIGNEKTLSNSNFIKDKNIEENITKDIQEFENNENIDIQNNITEDENIITMKDLSNNDEKIQCFDNNVEDNIFTLQDVNENLENQKEIITEEDEIKNIVTEENNVNIEELNAIIKENNINIDNISNIDNGKNEDNSTIIDNDNIVFNNLNINEGIESIDTNNNLNIYETIQNIDINNNANINANVDINDNQNIYETYLKSNIDNSNTQEGQTDILEITTVNNIDVTENNFEQNIDNKENFAENKNNFEGEFIIKEVNKGNKTKKGFSLFNKFNFFKKKIEVKDDKEYNIANYDKMTENEDYEIDINDDIFKKTPLDNEFFK